MVHNVTSDETNAATTGDQPESGLTEDMPIAAEARDADRQSDTDDFKPVLDPMHPDTAAPADASELPTSAVLKPLSSRTRKIVNIAIAILVPAAIAWFAYDNWDTFMEGPWDVRPWLLVVAGVLYLLSEGLPPLAWASLMRSAGSPAPNMRSVYFVWFAVEPLKYLPIPAGPIMGRYVLAHRVGLDPVPAVITLAYEYAITMVVTVTIAFPGFIWLAVFVEPGYRWAVILVGFILLLFGYAMLREGGLSRTVGDMFNKREHFEDKVKIPRRDLRYPAVIALVGFLIRICAAGTVLVALTPTDPWLAPLYGLVFTAGAMMPFSRFGTREAAIVVGLRALGFESGPALLSALVTRAFGLVASLILLAASAIVGGGRKAEHQLGGPGFDEREPAGTVVGADPIADSAPDD